MATPVLRICLLLVLAGCGTGTITTDAECGAGRVVVQGVCRQACNTSSNCGESQYCASGGCFGCPPEGCPVDCNVENPPDQDDDGICDGIDNCASAANDDQLDHDNDGVGDACDGCDNDPDNDVDHDGVCGDVDDCPNDADPTQTDGDNDGLGDACEACPGDPLNDVDDDGACGDVDVCPNDADPLQIDSDDDGAGDACDTCPRDANDDADQDGICGDLDECPDDDTVVRGPCELVRLPDALYADHAPDDQIYFAANARVSVVAAIHDTLCGDDACSLERRATATTTGRGTLVMTDVSEEERLEWFLTRDGEVFFTVHVGDDRQVWSSDVPHRVFANDAWLYELPGGDTWLTDAEGEWRLVDGERQLLIPGRVDSVHWSANTIIMRSSLDDENEVYLVTSTGALRLSEPGFAPTLYFADEGVDILLNVNAAQSTRVVVGEGPLLHRLTLTDAPPGTDLDVARDGAGAIDTQDRYVSILDASDQATLVRITRQGVAQVILTPEDFVTGAISYVWSNGAATYVSTESDTGKDLFWIDDGTPTRLLHDADIGFSDASYLGSDGRFFSAVEGASNAALLKTFNKGAAVESATLGTFLFSVDAEIIASATDGTVWLIYDGDLYSVKGATITRRTTSGDITTTSALPDGSLLVANGTTTSRISGNTYAALSGDVPREIQGHTLAKNNVDDGGFTWLAVTDSSGQSRLARYLNGTLTYMATFNYATTPRYDAAGHVWTVLTTGADDKLVKLANGAMTTVETSSYIQQLSLGDGPMVYRVEREDGEDLGVVRDDGDWDIIASGAEGQIYFGNYLTGPVDAPNTMCWGARAACVTSPPTTTILEMYQSGEDPPVAIIERDGIWYVWRPEFP